MYEELGTQCVILTKVVTSRLPGGGDKKSLCLEEEECMDLAILDTVLGIILFSRG